MKTLPEKFTSRMKQMLGEQYDAFIAEYDRPPVRGLRANLLKVSPQRLKELCPFELALTLTELADITLMDLNYAFDPFAQLKR